MLGYTLEDFILKIIAHEQHRLFTAAEGMPVFNDIVTSLDKEWEDNYGKSQQR